MHGKDYDFAGWVTKNDILCADGVTIKHDAFKSSDGEKVPLVWNHDYNSPNNVLGHVILKHEALGVYGYGYFNDTQEASNAKELVKHGDISSMSIGARKIKRSGSNVIHGRIYEVSLVLSGANPGAMIDSVVNHSDSGEEERGIVYTGTLIHTPDDILEHNDEDPKGDSEEKERGEGKVDGEKTIGDVIESLSEEQKEAVYALVGMVVEDEDDVDEDDEGDDDVKHNVFEQGHDDSGELLIHSINEAIAFAVDNKVSSLKDVLQHSENGEETLQHGINSIEMLFPEAAHSTNGNVPIIYKDPNTKYKEILNKVTKSPFSRVRTLFADLTEEEARAKGYIKGNFKKEEFFSLMRRETTPGTVYKKQKLDRDDIIDITDFDVVQFMNAEMRMMLEEELARAILVGDGRELMDEDKIDETKIRPIINDHEFFTIQKRYTGADEFLEIVINAMSEYRGSGNPDMYIDPTLLTEIKLLKGTDNRYLFGDIPTDSAIAARMGVGTIIPTTFMVGRGALIVNLRDYTVGATKGGEITNFDDFDIDFNQHKYLIETRLSGSLTMPKSAINLSKEVVESADDDKGGFTWGKRQADREREEEENQEPVDPEETE